MAVVTSGERTPRRLRSPGAPKKGSGSLRGLLPLALVLVVWELVSDESSFSFPPPSTWIGAIASMHERGSLLPSLATTLYTFAIALAVAIVVGAAVGMVVGASAKLERALTPIMDFFRTLPPPVIVPVATLLLGVTLQASLTIIVIAVVWPILLNAMAAMRAVPPVRLEMARSVGLTWRERLMKVIIPSCAPGIMIGVRIAVPIAVILTLLVDILGHAEGAGRLLVERQQRFDAEGVWGLLLIIGVFGYLLNVLLDQLERRWLAPWVRTGR